MTHWKRVFRVLPIILLLLPGLIASAGCSQLSKFRQPEVETHATYAEQHRPQLHFSPPSMWMNDPNGLVYHDGEYHLFYQYYPNDKVWGPMHWGHAVSGDLVHWQQLPIALFPDELGYIFSGSAVVDWNNSSGFGADGEPPLIAIFTYHNPKLAKLGGQDHEYQGIAFSNDRGRSWTKFAGNPVLPNLQKLQDFRDPKVFWHRQSGQWIMTLSATDHVQIWRSEDFKSWAHLSDFGREWGAHGGVWECPDLVEMQVEGSEESRWVLILNLNPGGPQGGSGTQYFVGNFDGTRFTLDESFASTLKDQGAVWLDAGRDNYAGVTWADIPREDGRTLFIGWMSNWDYAQQVPTHPWRGAMTVPRELSLRKTEQGFRVFSVPARELRSLRRSRATIDAATIDTATPLPINPGFPVSRSELVLEFELPDVGIYDFGIELSNEEGDRYRFGYESVGRQFYSDRRSSGDSSFADTFAGIHRANRSINDGTLRLHLLLDVASVEVFADGGATVMTDTMFPTSEYNEIEIFSKQGAIKLKAGTLYELSSIW
jgi:fructan beta-fructosidase